MQGSLPATGMKAVLVNGTVVLQDDTVILDRFPGQPIQFDPEDQPRFEPVSEEAWEQSFMTGTPHLEGSEFAEPAQD
jgi:N-acyl-D-glutamate deacylase